MIEGKRRRRRMKTNTPWEFCLHICENNPRLCTASCVPFQYRNILFLSFSFSQSVFVRNRMSAYSHAISNWHWRDTASFRPYLLHTHWLHGVAGGIRRIIRIPCSSVFTGTGLKTGLVWPLKARVAVTILQELSCSMSISVLSLTTKNHVKTRFLF